MTSQAIVVNAGTERYPVVFEKLKTLTRQLAAVGLYPGRCLMVTDDNVRSLYLDGLLSSLDDGGWSPAAYSVPPGEKSKSTETLTRLYDFALGEELDRSTPVFAVGGGVVGDLAGYFAATILRGVPLVHVPTTLVAQVDSSIGGKTGINHARGKNLIGAFYQPKLVLSDVETLMSLPEREWKAGLGEVVKHALLDGPALVEDTLARWGDLLGRDHGTLDRLIPRYAQTKVDVVTQDVTERSVRAYLNLGHTVAHAIENVAGYGTILHGEAVAIGLRVALRLSGLRFAAFDTSRAGRLVDGLHLKSLPGLAFDDLAEAMRVDKKNVSGQRRFVLLRAPGEPVVVDDVSTEELRDAWDYVMGT